MRVVLKNRIYVPDGTMLWAKSHAMNPTVDVLDEHTLRIYFSSLDATGIGRIGYVDVNSANPAEIKNVSTEPILDVGKNGTFDDNGLVPSSIVTKGGTKYLYYYGFQKVEKVRFVIFSGLALSHDNGNTWKRNSNVPVLDRTEEDLYMRSLPFAILENDIWKMWYSGVNKWVNINGKDLPFGEIKYAESLDGVNFNSSRLCLIPYDDEFSLSRAFVYKNDNVYKMIFSRRMKTDIYKLGYAESDDGISWKRNDDEIHISGNVEDWNSEMLCYTSLVTVNNKQYMFYNGNSFGKTGFGYAEVLED